MSDLFFELQCPECRGYMIEVYESEKIKDYICICIECNYGDVLDLFITQS